MVRLGRPPGAYVAAWRHIVTIFRAEGADQRQVGLVAQRRLRRATRSPRTSRVTNGSTTSALDGYNWGTSGAAPTWQRLAQVFSSSYKPITQLSAKPVIIAETSSSETGGDKAAGSAKAS